MRLPELGTVTEIWEELEPIFSPCQLVENAAKEPQEGV